MKNKTTHIKNFIFARRMGELKLSCLQQEKRLHEENMSCMREKNLHTEHFVHVRKIGMKPVQTHSHTNTWVFVQILMHTITTNA